MFEDEPMVTVPLTDICEPHWVDEQAIVRARERLVPADQAGHLAEIFAALSDPTRLRIIAALQDGELCVCDLSALLRLSQSATSHHLRLLRTLRIVRARREGKLVYYALDDDHVRHVLADGLRHVEER